MRMLRWDNLSDSRFFRAQSCILKAFNPQQDQQTENDAATMKKQAQLLAQRQQAEYLLALATQQADTQTARNIESVNFFSGMAGVRSTHDLDDAYSSPVVEENPMSYI